MEGKAGGEGEGSVVGDLNLHVREEGWRGRKMMGMSKECIEMEALNI